MAGCRCSHTVTPPTTACRMMPIPTARVSRGSSGRVFHRRTTERKARSATITSTPVRVRLPNSINPCTPSSGVGTSDSDVQYGQVSHPMPEPVRRTRPPVPTITMLLINSSQASTRVYPVMRSGRSADRSVGRAGAAVPADGSDMAVASWGCASGRRRPRPRGSVACRLEWWERPRAACRSHSQSRRAHRAPEKDADGPESGIPPLTHDSPS